MATISQAPATLDLVAVKGDDLTVTLTVTENGTAYDWTGATVATSILDSSGTEVATDFTVTTSAGGILTLALTDANTTTLGVATYRWQVNVTKASATRTWLAGALSVMQPGWGGTSTSSASLSITTGAATIAISNIATSASSVPITDSAGWYSGTNVEAALTELAPTSSTLWPWYGYDVLARELATGTAVVTLGKDTVYFRFFTAPQDMVATGISMASTATAAAGLTLCRFGLAHVGQTISATNETANQISWLARTANDTTLFTAINTWYQKSFDTTDGWPASVRLVRGERYAVAYMLSGTTAPTVVSMPAIMRLQVTTFGSSITSPPIGARPGGLEAYTDFPPTANFSSLINQAEASAPWYNVSCDPRSTLARPFRTAIVGDSYVATYPGWFSFGNAQSSARLLPILYAGVGGETTTQVLARLSAVTARSPQVTVVSCGINDVVQSATAAAIQANLTTIYQTLLTAGSKVLFCTLPPTSTMTGAMLTVLSTVNAWLKSLSVTGVWVSDTGNALTTGDGVTRNASLYIDGSHPNNAGCAAMAPVLATTITNIVASL